jgi:hypothetical protein
LTDLSDATEFAVSAGEIERNAALNSTIARLPTIRLAIVDSTDSIYGMARMGQAHTDTTGWTSRAFRTKSDALS